LWCCYRLLRLHLPLPTIAITIITVTMPTGLHNLQPSETTRAGP
jgi:hypothetical protein